MSSSLSPLLNRSHQPETAGLPRQSAQKAAHSYRSSWMLVGTLVCLVILLALIALSSDGWLSPGIRLSGGLLLSALALFFSVALAVRIQRDERERDVLQVDLQSALDQTIQSNQRLEAVLLVNRKVATTGNEKEIIDFVLQIAAQLTGAAGASYVPLDERSQPLSVVRLGEQPMPIDDDWLEYLASPAVRSRCSGCTELESEDPSCPLLRGPFAETHGVLCLPVRRGEREYGILNIHLPEPGKIDHETRRFLRSIVDETALAIEGLRLRQREIDSYHQLELARQKTDLKAALQALIDGLRDSFSADFAVLDIKAFSDPRSAFEIHLESGRTPVFFNHPMAGAFMNASAPGQPVIVPFSEKPLSTAGRLTDGTPEGDLIVTSLVFTHPDSHGFLLVGCRQPGSFLPRQLPLVQTTAGQAALLVENMQQMTELQVRTMLEERTRLAREIHDGLAQTIGYLKLQMAQMQVYLERGEKDRLRETLKKSYRAISEAYQEARFAIDGLRVAPNNEPFNSWLRQVVEDFQKNFASDVSVSLQIEEILLPLPSEVQVQLIRIIQEALSNIRKHASAKNIWINCSLVDGKVALEIRDDGQGFQPEEITGPSRHGLQSMRERAELIGAGFQVQSLPAQGTQVVVRLPLGQEEVVE